ncbi:hypothetical protein [Ruegeria atlantica]|uniref:hypothetical protein n=1 Tax=Ruegeria atlantica TaxID=81569 RepID=UPI00249543C8|nr:hypothetical protein [Ruegeria atlantica]
MTSGLVLKYLNGDFLIMREGYESTLPASTQVLLTRPAGPLCCFALVFADRRWVGKVRRNRKLNTARWHVADGGLVRIAVARDISANDRTEPKATSAATYIHVCFQLQ